MHKKTYTQSELIAEGWTKALIAKFLPEPELKANPRYKGSAPMKIWREEVVEAAIQSDGYAEAKAKSDKRKESAKKAVNTKTNNFYKRIEQILEDVKIKVIPMDELRKCTLEAKQKWYDYQSEIRDQERGEHWAYDAEDSTVERWMVNYIRHNLTIYDYMLYSMIKENGDDVIYFKIHDGIIRKISDAYPMLSDACKNQLFIRE